MQESQVVQSILSATGGRIVDPDGAVGPNLDQRILEEREPIITDQYHENWDIKLSDDCDIDSLVSEIVQSKTRPLWGPQHRMSVTVLDGEAEACLTAIDESPKVCKRKKKERGPRLVTEPKLESMERSVRQTRKSVRHKAIMMNADNLWTLTTKRSITDRSEFERLITIFLSKMRRLLKTSKNKFHYILVFEKHDSENTSPEKLGSFHAHIAFGGKSPWKKIHKLWHDSFEQMYGEPGHKNCSFHCDTGMRGRAKGKHRRGKIAKYLLKYIGKEFSPKNLDFTDPEIQSRFNKKRYWCSRGIEKPIKRTFYFPRGLGAQYVAFKIVEMLTGKVPVHQFDSDEVDLPDGVPHFHWYSTY